MIRVTLCALLLAFTSLANAAIHARLGADGHVHVSETPAPGTQPFNPLQPRPSRPRVRTGTAAASTPPRGSAWAHPLIDAAGQQAGVDAALLHAVVQVESAYNPRAVSRAGAAGLMQLMPATAKRFGVRDRFDAAQNLSGGAAYLAWLIKQFDGDLELVLAAYNAGEGAVRRHGNTVPPYAETRAYVRRVLALYAR